jgi:hypothetical protein
MVRRFSAAVVILALSQTGLAADLLVEKRDGASGNTEISIVNRGDTIVSIRGATINRSSDPACQLLAWNNSFGHALARSDLKDGLADSIAEDYEWLPSLNLPFGGQVDGVIYRGCGRVLQIDIWYSDETGETFTFER